MPDDSFRGASSQEMFQSRTSMRAYDNQIGVDFPGNRVYLLARKSTPDQRSSEEGRWHHAVCDRVQSFPGSLGDPQLLDRKVGEFSRLELCL
jgi:hypothetical protein